MSKLGRATTVSLWGVQAKPVIVEVAILNGLPSFNIVGLPDTAVNEAKERLRASFAYTDLTWHTQRITVNLSPADTVKTGSGFDLAIAAALISAAVGKNFSAQIAILGELGLDGSVRQISGVLPTALACKNIGITELVVPAANYLEASLVSGIKIHPVSHLAQLAKMLGVSVNSSQELIIPQPANLPVAQRSINMNEVYGQEEAVWALQVAAVGKHHIQLVGAPGVGKSMLAERFATILPQVSEQEAVEIAAISSILGEKVVSLPKERPFISPHHSASAAALIGGGAKIPKPGAVTRAHNGVLYCDEFPEFSPKVVQALRQPLEHGYIDLYRSKANVRYPADFQLVVAANPCPCGFAYDDARQCKCTVREKIRYQASLSGPIKDRIDISCVLRRPKQAQLVKGKSVDSEILRAQVEEAVERSRYRLQRIDAPVTQMFNARLSGSWLRKNTKVSVSMQKYFTQNLQAGTLSMRALDRVLRLSWSIADLQGKNMPDDDAIAAALVLNQSKKQV